MLPSSYILCILMMSFRVIYGRKIAGVLNINQVDFSMQSFHFEHYLDDDVDVLVRSKRDARNIVINPDETSKILFTESFNDTSNLDTNWDMNHMVEVVEEIIDDDNTSNSKNVSLSKGEGKKRGVDGELTPVNINSSKTLTPVNINSSKTLEPPTVTISSANDTLIKENATLASNQGMFHCVNKINRVFFVKMFYFVNWENLVLILYDSKSSK